MTILRFNQQLTRNSIESFIKTYIDKIKPGACILETARKNLYGQTAYKDLKTSVCIGSFEDSTVFIADRPTYITTRRCIRYKYQGHKTILITRWGVETHQLNYFDEIYIYNSLFDLAFIPFEVAKIIMVQTWVGWHILPVYISMLARCPIICDFTDLTCLLFYNLDDYQLIGLSKEETHMDLLCERYMIESRHLCYIPYEPKVLEILSKKGYQIRNIVHQPSHAEPEFFAQSEPRDVKENELHVVFLGGFPPDQKPDLAFGDAKLKGVLEYIIDKDIKVTVLNNPMLAFSHIQERDYPYYSSLKSLFDNFTFDCGCPPWLLKDLIHNYQFGLMVYDFNHTIMTPSHYNNIIPSKLFTYIELELPIIVSAELTAVANIVLNNDLGFVISRSELKDIVQLIKNNCANIKTWKKNIRQYRNQVPNDLNENSLREPLIMKEVPAVHGCTAILNHYK